MTALLRASEIIGRPVVSIEDGEDVAEIRDVVYDADRHRLLGFTLNKRGWFRGRMKDLLPADTVAGLGPDAVTIEGCDALSAADEVRAELSEPSPNREVIGVRVVTEDGRELGVVRDVVVQTGANPEAVGYEIERAGSRSAPNLFVPISAQVAVSGDALVLPADAAEYAREDLSGFGSAVDDYRTRLGGAR